MSGDIEDLPRVRKPFRMLGGIVGAMMVIGGPVGLFLGVSEWHEHGFSSDDTLLLLTMLGTLPFVLMLLWAARTGRDLTALFDRWLARVFGRGASDD